MGGRAFLEERMRVCKCEFMFMTTTVCLGMVVYESECVPVYMGLLTCEFTHTQTVSVEEESLKTKVCLDPHKLQQNLACLG